MDDRHDRQTLGDYAAGEIRAELARRQSTGKELAQKLEVSRSWVSYRLTGTTEITLNDLQRIAAALEMEFADLLPKPAYRDERGEPARRRNTASSSPPPERTMRSTHVASGGCTHSPDGHAPSDISDDQVRRPAIKSWRHEQVTQR